MKTPLDDIERKNYFTTPDGYFEDLPMRIQQRTSESRESTKPVWIPVLRYAIPVIIVGLLTFQFFRTSPIEQDSDILVSITSEEALDYLAESDIAFTEIIPVVYAEQEIEDLIKAPSAEEEYALLEEILFTPEWNFEEEEIEIEDI